MFFYVDYEFFLFILLMEFFGLNNIYLVINIIYVNFRNKILKVWEISEKMSVYLLNRWLWRKFS